MQRIALILLVVAIALADRASGQTTQLVTTDAQKIKQIELPVARAGPAKGKRDEKLEPVALFHRSMPAGVAVSRGGRIFMTFPRWDGSVKATAVEVTKDGKLAPFPDEAAYDGKSKHHIDSAQGIVIDAKDRLWLLDAGSAKLRVYDIDTRRMLREYTFDPKVLGDGPYLNDVRVDPSGGFGGLAYISDSMRGGVIVLDLASNEAWRRLEKAPQARAKEDFVATVEGETLAYRSPGNTDETPLRGNTDGIALSPDGGTLYFTAYSSHDVYAVPTALLVDQRIPNDQVEAQITKVATKPSASDGILCDAEGRVYTTDYEDNAIRRVTPGKGPDQAPEIIVQDERILWPDALWIHDGYLYITTNQMNRMPNVHRGKDRREKPYALFRYPVTAKAIGSGR